MASNPTLLLGARANPNVYEHRRGIGDGAVLAFDLSIKSHRLAPAGAGGACIFRSLFIALRHREAQPVYVSAWVDDRRVVDRYLVQLFDVAETTSSTAEVPLSEAVMIGGVDRARQRPQGVWIQVQLVALGVRVLAIDGLDVEWEQVQRRF